MRLIFSLFLIMSTLNAEAGSNHFILFGGGGESERKETTIFDRSLEGQLRFATSNERWTVDAAFNGGHEVTEGILTRHLHREVPPFNNNSFNTILEDYERRIRAGEIGEGDQILLSVLSHGARNRTGLTHEVAGQGVASDLQSLEGAELINLDRLESFRNLANERGIRLAILDFSCYSGNTMALANDRTCVITTSDKENPSLVSGLSDIFSHSMRRGRNLHQVFLSSLNDTRVTVWGHPLISSPVTAELLHLIELEDFMARRPQTDLNCLPEEALQFSEINEFAQSIQGILSLDRRRFRGQRDLISNLTRTYDDFRRSFQEREAFLERHFPESARSTFCSDESVIPYYCTEANPVQPCEFSSSGNEVISPQPVCIDLPHRDLMSMNRRLVSNYRQVLESTEDDTRRNYISAVINMYDKAFTAQAALGLREISQQFRELDIRYRQALNRYLPAAENVRLSVMEEFSQLYRRRLSTDRRRNPCMDFNL